MVAHVRFATQSSSSARTPTSALQRGLTLLKFTLATSGLALALGLGCSEQASRCAGIEVEGKCVARCADSGCAENNRCVENTCVPRCSNQNDCATGTNCVDVKFSETDTGNYCVAQLGGASGQDGVCSDDTQCDTLRGYHCVTVANSSHCRATGCTNSSQCPNGFCRTGGSAAGKPTNYCQPGSDGRGGTGDAGTGGDASTCSTAESCDTLSGFACINNHCRLADCTRHSDCQGLGLCTLGGTDSSGKQRNFCDPAQLEGEARGKGQFGTHCVNGQKDCAQGFRCIGAGPGDLNAYCTRLDCQSNTDCATGYHCARVRVRDAPCESSACSNIQAKSSDPKCIPTAAIGAGKQYECGALNLRRMMCRRADFCSPCEKHEDCLAEAGQVCAKDVGGVKRCTVPCDQGTGSCPWGNAASCKVWDTELGFATCAHRFGACTGTGKSCHPCVTSTDCGTTGLCASSPNTGEKFCIDLAQECSCAGFGKLPRNPRACQQGTCPDSPGGLKLTCYGFLNDPSHALNNRCYGANTNQGTPQPSTQLGCWPSL